MYTFSFTVLFKYDIVVTYHLYHTEDELHRGCDFSKIFNVVLYVLTQNIRHKEAVPLRGCDRGIDFKQSTFGIVLNSNVSFTLTGCLKSWGNLSAQLFSNRCSEGKDFWFATGISATWNAERLIQDFSRFIFLRW